MSSSQAARTAGSTLWPNIAPGSDSTPSLITITSIAPTFSAYRDGTNSCSGLPWVYLAFTLSAQCLTDGCGVLSKLMFASC
jgi:hypothetical protein